jgi:hypothetical protein
MVLSTSADGLTWTAPTRIPLAPASSTESFFIPGLAADPLHPGGLGLVYAYFHAGSCRRGTCLVGIGFGQSRDGGKTWSTQQLDAQPFSTNWASKSEGGRMIGDYFAVSFAGDRVVPVFPLATSPLKRRFRQGIFATSLRALG